MPHTPCSRFPRTCVKSDGHKGACMAAPKETAPALTTPHTPGPWRVSRDRAADIRSATMVVRDREQWSVAYLFGCECPRHDKDARLIAAAPEMLEALRAMLEYFVENVGEPLTNAQSRASCAARALLARIEKGE